MRRCDWDGRGPRRSKVVVVGRPLWLPDERDTRDLRLAQVLAVVACAASVVTACLALAYWVSRMVG